MVSCMACVCILAYLGLTVILYDLEYDLCCLYDCIIKSLFLHVQEPDFHPYLLLYFYKYLSNYWLHSSGNVS